MSKALQEKIDELFEATKELRSLEEIKPHCEKFNEWVNTNTSYSTKSLGTVLSRYGFYKKFKSIPLEQGKNAEAIAKHDENGNVKGHELRHYAVLLCGLDQSDWKQRNETARVIGRLGNDQEIDPDAYLEVTGQLLESSDPHELAVGIIAATGRRPHEIIARAKFAPVEGQAYQVQFEGQGKKRGDKPVFPIATLYPGEYVIKCLHRLRREASTKALLKEVANEFPNDLAAQNRAIDSRRNGSLNRVVREYFGDKDEKAPVLAFRHGEEQDNCKALRAAYGALATERDCDRSVGSKMLHYARLLGHFVKEEPTDKELQAVATTLGYADYFTTKPVPFPTAPEKEKTTSIRVNEFDLEPIKKLQQKWKLPNQQAVISKLIERHELAVELGKQLQEFKSRINQLEKEKAQLSQVQTQQEKEKPEMSQPQAQSQTEQTTANMETLEAKIERLIEEKLNKALSNLALAQPSNQAIESKPQNKAPAKEVEAIDWGGMSNADLWTTKVKGASEEKIRRSYEAICLYNDTVATGDDDRLAITNQALRELSGVNGLLVGDWIKAHADEVISHNSKYGMQNSKDPSKAETYYNKRHGAEKISKILGLVNDQFLEGEALKSQQGK
ncbi:MAG TPA: protelomerase family protein [Allocoleopsis sp.]